MQKILILAANPKDTGELRLDEELREIDDGLRRAKHRDEFELCQRHAVRARDVRRAMLDEMPQVVHFSGYGSATEGLLFEDEQGFSRPASQSSLANLIELFADPEEFEQPITCVVLNGCYSKGQAEAIAKYVPFVIGLAQTLDNKRRIGFAVGFYDALGAGRSVEFAFKFACSASNMSTAAGDEPVPVLIPGIPLVQKPPSSPQTAPSHSTGTAQAAGTLTVVASDPPPHVNSKLWKKVGLAALALTPILLGGYWQGSRALASHFYSRGDELYNAGDTLGAQANFRKALRFNPSLAEANFSLALTHEDLTEFDEARAAYTKAKDAGLLGAVNNLARLEITEFEDYESAANMLLLVLNSPQREQANLPLEYSLHKNLGWAWLEQNRLLEAKEQLDEANRLEAQLDNPRPDSYCLLAQVYERQGKPEDAVDQWQTCRIKITRPEDDSWKGLANQALSENKSSDQ